MSKSTITLEEINQTAAFIKERISETPQVGIILGTGLGGLATEIQDATVIDYADIPNMPLSTVTGHSGQLIFGKLGGKQVVAMKGRFHYYEGYSMQQITFPVRVMKVLGVERLFVSNASGGVNPDFEIGDLMIITDHINLFGTNPLIGPNMDEFGVRFPDMSDAYDAEMVAKAREIAEKNAIKVQSGVYAGLSGPCLETPAEYLYVRIIGADAVGMSTVPEVIVARHMQMPVFAISMVTDLGVPGKIVKVTHEDVQQVAEANEPYMTQIMRELIASV